MKPIRDWTDEELQRAATGNWVPDTERALAAEVLRLRGDLADLMVAYEFVAPRPHGRECGCG